MIFISPVTELHQLLLKLFIDFHAWSTSRPEFESTSTGNTLFEETQAILTREKEQGMWSFLLGMRACNSTPICSMIYFYKAFTQ